METSSETARESLTKSGGGSTGGDETGSQSSQRSRTSLLERIRAQRERDAAAGGGGGNSSTSNAVGGSGRESNSTPSTIQVPQYSPIPQSQDPAQAAASSTRPQAFGGDVAGSSSGFFSQAWSNISHSMETGMASLQQEQADLEARDALLPPTADEEEGNYTMVGYFTTFVRDVYDTFLNLPLLVRVIVVFALIYTAWEFI